MGPNHYFNNDLFGRVHFLVAALTDNIGHIGGNVGSYAGNYRGSLFQAMPQWILENPFDIELDLTKPARVKKYYKAESAHYWNYGERPLRAVKTGGDIHEGESITGKSHMPTPTKVIWFGNSNSLLGNAKWSFDVVKNTLPRQDAIFCNEWHWTSSCEYADMVFPADSWAEFKLADMTASCTNPFLLAFPTTPLERIHNSRSDYEILALTARELGKLVQEPRMADYWKGVLDGDPSPYLQRILSGSNATRGTTFDDLHASSKEGTPLLMNARTYPRAAGWEQRQEDKPWYTPTGRLEFYRPEREFQEAGESLPVWREPVDATFYDPNSILSNKDHPSIKPRGPESYGVPVSQRDAETRQYRNVVHTWAALRETQHPLHELDPAYRFIFQTPKYRWGAHSTAVDADWIAMLFGPFGDPYRRDPRSPWTGEAYFEIHPRDAIELGLNDGDYAWIDADPADRPYRELEGRRAVLRRRPRDDARPRLLGDDARPHPHVVQHVRRDARHGRSTGRGRGQPGPEPGYELRRPLPARQPPVRNARLAASDADDGDADAEELLRPGDRRRLRSGRPLGLRERRRRRSSRSSEPRTAVPARPSSGGRSRSGSAPSRPASHSSPISRATT